MLGGTFDPVHRGHVELAMAARDFLGLDSLLMVPVNQPPHRDQPVASAQQRLHMLQLALRDRPGLVADAMEIERGGVSRSILSVRQLKHRFPDSQPLLILGWDSFVSLPTWFEWSELKRTAAFLVCKRRGVSSPLPDELAAQLECVEHPCGPGQYALMEVEPAEISATQIRRAVAAGRTIDDQIDPGVARFIAEQRLYRTYEVRQ